MKFTCSKKDLTKLLATAESVISTKNSVSILSNVLLETTNNSTIKITAFDTIITFFGEINADIEEQGRISVYNNRFFSITKKLPEEEILISTNEEDLVTITPLNSKSIKYDLKGINANKFPPVKSIEDINFFPINQKLFAEMIKKTKISVPTNESRRFINGVLIEKNDDSLKMVSTDGKRLSFIQKKVDITNNLPNILVPIKILQESVKLFSDENDIYISLTKENIYLNIGNYYFISNLLEGNFPPYEKVIPLEQDTFFTVDKNNFFSAIDRVSLLGDKETHKIILDVSKTTLRIYSENNMLGFGEEIIPIEYNGEDLKMALNYTYILDFLSVCNGEKITMAFKNAQSTIVAKDDNDDDYIHVMMPMSL